MSVRWSINPISRLFQRSCSRLPHMLLAMFCFFCPAKLDAAFDSAASRNAGEPLILLRITPAGDDVPAGRQVVLEFNQPVVPLGRMEREASEIPVAIEPALNCQWRWLNPSTLACQLGEKDALRPATRYHVTVRPEFQTQDGATLAEGVTHSFITERARITGSWFKEWLAPGMPTIAVRFNQPIQHASASSHLYFQTQKGSRFAATVTEDPDSRESIDTPQEIVWLVSPAEELPLDTAVNLHVKPGILSSEGPEPGVENRTVVAVHTFPPFRFLGVACQTNAGKEIRIAPGQAVSPQTRCNPVQEVSLLFTSPVIKEEVQQGLEISPPLGKEGSEADPWEEVYSYSRLSEPHSKGQVYRTPLPNVLKAFADYELRAQAGAITDEFGRSLPGAVSLAFKTDHRPPHFFLFKHLPVLEKALDTEAPLLVTNLQQIQNDFHRLTPDGSPIFHSRSFPVPKIVDKPFAMPLGVRDMVGKGSGLVYGHLTTKPEVANKNPWDRWFFAQVTPFHLHVKLGHYNTLVWVTDLQTGQPVPDVQVQIRKDAFPEFAQKPEILSQSVTREDGTATLAGTVEIDPELKLLWTYETEAPRFFVHCLKGDDMAVLPLTYDFEVASEGANREYIPDWMRQRHGHLRAWGATAQGVYKVGDTVQFKIYVRDQDNERFVAPPGAADTERASAGGAASSGPPKHLYHLKVVDPMEKVVFERKDVVLSRFGALDDAFPIPRNGAVGWYRFVLSASFTEEEWEPMRVLVSDFTPAPFKVTTDLNGKLFSIGETVKVTTQATLHAGGPYAKAGARINASLTATPFVPEDPKAKGFKFDVLGVSEYQTPESQTVYQTEGTLDENGILETTFTLPSTSVLYGRLTVEGAVRDDRGKFVANRATADYAGLDQYVGLFQGSWTLEQGRPATARAIVVDRFGKAVSGTPIRITAEREVTRASRVKGAGDAYLTQYTHEWVQEETFELVSSLDPVDFQVTPKHPGTYRITAQIGSEANQPDQPGQEHEAEAETTASEIANSVEAGTAASAPDAGTPQTFGVMVSTPAEGSMPQPPTDQKPNTQNSLRVHKTTIQRWVVGKGHVLWESVPGNLLNVTPEKAEYRIGETARFLVQNPFPGAKALITLERFGILKSWVETLEESTALVEVPVEPDFLPGFYLSVTVMSPRVERPTGEPGAPGSDAEDLGKPTFRMGYVQLTVNDAYKEIDIQGKPEREVYKPRETVAIDFLARPRNLNAGEPSPPVELAVTVLDEAVFDLLRQGRDAFDPYKGFYSLDSLDLRNYNLIMQLIGRQKLEKKGANPGGGGGPDLGLRSLFKFVSYWNPSIPSDADGRARIQFEIPDNLTGWRVLAMAVTPDDRMGLGDTVFRVNQPTEIRPVLPNQVTEGDRFEAGFSIMNRTDRPRTLDVAIQATGPVEDVDSGEERAKSGTAGMTRQVTLQPFERTTVRLPLKTTGHGEIVLTAQAGDQQDRDAVRHTLAVQRRQSLEVAAAYGTTTAGEVTESVVFPQNMRPDTGRLNVTLSPTVIGSVEGAFDYMRHYPYTCWEQKLTVAVMAAYHQELKPYLAKDFTWEGSHELPEKTLALAAEFQAPNGGMTYYVPKDEYASPYLSAYTALALNWLRALGHTAPRQVEERLHDYLQNMLRRDVMPDFFTKGMASTVRAVALAALAEQGKITRDDIDRYWGHMPEMSLFGKAHYLQALIRIPGTEPLQQEVITRILAHGNQSGGTYIFSETLDSLYHSILTSSVRDNCAILSALLAYDAANPSQSTLGDIPFRLTRTIAQSRKGRAHWASTQENVFAVKALVDFSRIYEAEPPNLKAKAQLDLESLGEAAFTSVTDPPADFAYAVQAGDVGRKATVKIERTGEGRLYYATTLSYAPAELKADAINAGIEIHREYSVERDGRWVLLQGPMEIRTGELVRVDLFVSVPAARYFVVVDDPVPGGLEPVSRDLATASTVDADKGESERAAGSYWYRFDDWIDYGYSFWGFYHKELRHSAARFYSEILPAGRYHLSYTAQAIAPGEFTTLPVHGEEMYNPDLFGKGVPGILRVRLAE